MNESAFVTGAEGQSEASAPAGSTPGPISILSPEPASPLDFDPVDVRARCDGWTPARQRAFIEELAACGVVREAAGRVGMTERSANRLRVRSDARAFSLAWEAAVQIGTDRLRSIAYERAVTGVVKRRYFKGEVVGEERVYDNKLLIHLMGAIEPFESPLTACPWDASGVTKDWDNWMAAIEDGTDKPTPEPDEEGGAPVWEAKDHSWWTSFPPPPGYKGKQVRHFGHQQYRRECTDEEMDALQARHDRREAKQAARRDAYFTRMK